MAALYRWEAVPGEALLSLSHLRERAGPSSGSVSFDESKMHDSGFDLKRRSN
jgi:hypothetical protein